MNNQYEETADELVQRIRRLGTANPEVFLLESAWDLFKIGLKCDDLQPSAAQASWAFNRAKQLGPINE